MPGSARRAATDRVGDRPSGRTRQGRGRGDQACPGITKTTGAGSICGGVGVCSEATGTCTCPPCFEVVGGICKAKADPSCGKGAAFCNRATGNKECKCPGALGGSGCATCQCKNGKACNSITFQCECGSTHIGKFCDFACSRTGACNNHGECDVAIGGCRCDEGWLGKFCDQPAYTCTPPAGGMYVTAVCDPIKKIDTKTAACAKVGAGQYVMSACVTGSITKLGQNTGISACSVCGVGQWAATACGGTSPGKCSRTASCLPCFPCFFSC